VHVESTLTDKPVVDESVSDVGRLSERREDAVINDQQQTIVPSVDLRLTVDVLTTSHLQTIHSLTFNQDHTHTHTLAFWLVALTASVLLLVDTFCNSRGACSN